MSSTDDEPHWGAVVGTVALLGLLAGLTWSQREKSPAQPPAPFVGSVSNSPASPIPLDTQPQQAFVPFVPAYAYEEGESREAKPGDDDEDGKLDDGSYMATVENTSTGNGPYELEVEKSGDEVTINFSNGGFIVTDVNSQDFDGSSWQLDTSHSSESEDWEVTITP
ncbi:MAG: hypothetical protein JWM80_1261 [Cyanobacteria bacterium RYN_339]|nr:hypothetical protein [Cyanobacteria bacterium RYN_339]